MLNAELYHREVPELLQDFIEIPMIKRLQYVGMNCGCEYTAFPRFRELAPYSRLDHSVGVASIIWRFTQDPAQTIAGLLHDIATPVFAHVVDFMRGDYLRQEATESSTREMIESSGELQLLLKQYNLTTEDVSDYHRYPIADNETPRLSSDRLEYTFGNSVNYGICTRDEISQICHDLVVGTNEDGQEELMFRNRHMAELFADAALKCARIYVSDEDRYSMQILSEILAFAMQHHVIQEGDLYLTEPEVIAKLLGNSRTKDLWNSFCAMDKMISAETPDERKGWRKIDAKKRFIDPMVLGRGRLSSLSLKFGHQLEAFRADALDYWICAVS